MEANIPEDPGNTTDPDEGTSAQSTRRLKRVSFADTTSVHVYCRDEDFETPPEAQTGAQESTPILSKESPADSVESDSSKEFSQEENHDDEEIGHGLFIRNIEFTSPGSVAESMTSNDDDNFFGPVANELMRCGRPSIESADSCDPQDVTLDSTAFSLHFRSLNRSDDELSNFRRSFKSPTAVLSEMGTPTRGHVPITSPSVLSLLNKKEPSSPIRQNREIHGDRTSDGMGLATKSSQNIDYALLSPSRKGVLTTQRSLLPSKVSSLSALVVSPGKNGAQGIKHVGHSRNEEPHIPDEQQSFVIANQGGHFPATKFISSVPVASGSQKVKNGQNECTQCPERIIREDRPVSCEHCNELIAATDREGGISSDKSLEEKKVVCQLKEKEHLLHSSLLTAETPVIITTENLSSSDVLDSRFCSAKQAGDNRFPMASLHMKRRRLFNDTVESLITTRKGTPFRIENHHQSVPAIRSMPCVETPNRASIPPASLARKNTEAENDVERQSPRRGAVKNLTFAIQDEKPQSECDIALPGNDLVHEDKLAVTSSLSFASGRIAASPYAGAEKSAMGEKVGKSIDCSNSVSISMPLEGDAFLLSKQMKVHVDLGDNGTIYEGLPSDESPKQNSERNIFSKMGQENGSNSELLMSRDPEEAPTNLLRHISDLEITTSGMSKTIGEKSKHLKLLLAEFCDARFSVLPLSIYLLNSREIGRVENLLLQQEFVRKYTKRSDEIHSNFIGIARTTNVNKTQQRRAVEARWLLHKVIYERAKFELLTAKKECLHRKSQQLKALIWEFTTLKENFLQHKQYGVRTAESEVFLPAFMQSAKEEACNKVNTMKQELAILDQKIVHVADSLRANSKERGIDTGAVHLEFANFLKKEACCSALQHHLQLWELDDIIVTHDYHTVFLNYGGILTHRFTANIGHTCSLFSLYQLDHANIEKKFPSMDAIIAFEFLFNPAGERMIERKLGFCKDTQATALMLVNLLVVLEELKWALVDLPNLAFVNFESTRSDELLLNLGFVDFSNGGKLKLMFDLACLRSAVYPSEIGLAKVQIEASGCCTLMSSEIADSIKCVGSGVFFISRICEHASCAVNAVATQ